VEIVLHALVAVLGLLVGSFLNVVIWRVPRGESVVRPGSHCPGCGAPVRPRDNVPVLSWLALRGRCRDCGTRISVRYPAVEAATAGLFLAVSLWRDVSPDLPAFLYLAAVALALTLIDLDVHRLPDRIVLPAYPVTLLLLTAAAAISGAWPDLLRAALGGLALFAVYAVLVLVYPAGMGLGDVKLAGVLGIALGWVGWGAVVVGGFAAFLLGGVFGIALLVTRRVGRRTGIPFGPWMIVGAAVGAVVGEPLWSAYLGALA
jgi:leader peptidase (prepilin peptidase)/N-methyltransferase